MINDYNDFYVSWQNEENKTQHNMCWKPIYTNAFAYKWKFLDGNIEILSFVGKFRS
jgi:hypothetical protein